MREPLDVALRKLLRERMNDLADALARGEMSTIEQYKETCGEIRGLARAEAELLALAKKYNGPDEDDN